jgi:hypothetical protein
MLLTEAAFGSCVSAQGVWIRSRLPVMLSSLLISIHFSLLVVIALFMQATNDPMTVDEMVFNDPS